jgi:hypothetical protein
MGRKSDQRSSYWLHLKSFSPGPSIFNTTASDNSTSSSQNLCPSYIDLYSAASLPHSFQISSILTLCDFSRSLGTLIIDCLAPGHLKDLFGSCNPCIWSRNRTDAERYRIIIILMWKMSQPLQSSSVTRHCQAAPKHNIISNMETPLAQTWCTDRSCYRKLLYQCSFLMLDETIHIRAATNPSSFSKYSHTKLLFRLLFTSIWWFLVHSS